MHRSRIVSSRLGARYGAVAVVAALSGKLYSSQRPIAYCDSPRDHPSLLYRHPYTSDLPRRQYSTSNENAESEKRGEAGLISDVDKDELSTYRSGFEDDDTSAWSQFSGNFSAVIDTIADVQWSTIPDRLTDFIVPSWARDLSDAFIKLQSELSLAPGSLADDIWKEAGDQSINPEILWDARVRIGSELPKEELEFLKNRKKHVIKALAQYLDLKEQIHPDDIPTIAMCGSGGGLRALVAGTSSYLSAQEAGLFDCVTYTAGVSGSCWLQTLYFSSVSGQNFHNLIKHLKNRIGVHIAFPPAALKAITTAPTNKFLLSGFVEKLKGDPGASFGLVDIYGLLLGARLLVPKGDLGVIDTDLKLSNQRIHTDSGHHPMPIYTAVRHEIPIEEEEKRLVEEGKAPADDIREKAKQEAWFQWFETTPYEFFCEELGAGIPTWAMGRPFDNGRNTILDSGLALPESRIPLMMGVWGSAFCATLAHYYKEIRPALIGYAGFDGLDSLVSGKNDDLVKLHPIEPATVPNYVVGLKEQLPQTCPESLFKTDHIQLMDAGMSNNLPIYPLLRPGRDVDVVIAFDASADIQKENWLSVVDGYARQRGIKAWPVGVGWPAPSSEPGKNVEALEEAQATSPQEAAMKVAEAREEGRKQTDTSEDTSLGYCTIWVGSLEERATGEEPPPSKRISAQNESDRFHLMNKDAGMTVVYFPLLPNPKVPGIDPDKTDFLSTWNFVYTPENVQSVVDLAKANFEDGAQQVKDTIRAVYERRKTLRLEKEKNDLTRHHIKRWRSQLRKDGDHFQ